MLPTSTHVNERIAQFNQLGAELTKLKKQRYKDLSRLDSIGNEMRETVGIVAEIFECQLKVTQELLEKPEAERDFDWANRKLDELTDAIKQDNLNCYQSLLDARPGFMEAGQFVKLTHDKKNDMMTSCALLIDDKIAQNRLVFCIGMDLEAIEKKVANAQHEQLALFDTLLNSKTAINMNLEAQNSQCKKIKELQLEIISAQNQTTNVWEASEKGNLAFLTQEINKLWFWEKNDFINDSSKGFTILALAASHNHLKCVKYLLDNKANPNISDKMGYVPLHWAAKNGNVKIGKLLLKNKASINPRGEYGRTPLDMAVRHHQVEFVKLLLKYGADINAQTTEAGGTSVLHETVMIQDVPMLITLIADSNLNVNLRDSKHKTPLYYAIVLGLSEFAAAIVGHSSFQWPEDVTDPNHISQLLRITPEQNSEQIKRFLNHYKGN